jgi:hypothetical protein
LVYAEQETTRRGEIKEQVLRILLNYPDGSLSKYRIWKLSEGSQTWVYDFINILEEKGYLDDTRVTDPRGLFEYWAENRVIPDEKHYMVRNPMQLLEDVEREYALTTYRAENLVQNHLFPSRTDIYCKTDDLEYWHSLLGKKGLVGGGNFRTLYGSNHIFFGSSRVQGYTVVSTPQLIVDLLVEGGPCVEAAEMLIEKYMAENV